MIKSVFGILNISRNYRVHFCTAIVLEIVNYGGEKWWPNWGLKKTAILLLTAL